MLLTDKQTDRQTDKPTDKGENMTWGMAEAMDIANIRYRIKSAGKGHATIAHLLDNIQCIKLTQRCMPNES